MKNEDVFLNLLYQLKTYTVAGSNQCVKNFYLLEKELENCFLQSQHFLGQSMLSQADKEKLLKELALTIDQCSLNLHDIRNTLRSTSLSLTFNILINNKDEQKNFTLIACKQFDFIQHVCTVNDKLLVFTESFLLILDEYLNELERMPLLEKIEITYVFKNFDDTKLLIIDMHNKSALLIDLNNHSSRFFSHRLPRLSPLRWWIKNEILFITEENAFLVFNIENRSVTELSEEKFHSKFPCMHELWRFAAGETIVWANSYELAVAYQKLYKVSLFFYQTYQKIVLTVPHNGLISIDQGHCIGIQKQDIFTLLDINGTIEKEIFAAPSYQFKHHVFLTKSTIADLTVSMESSKDASISYLLSMKK